MKKRNEFNVKYLYIILFSLFVLFIFLIISVKKDVKEKVVYNGWYSSVDSTNYISINDFSINTCNFRYYSPYFEIKDYNLYDYNGELILEGIYTMFTVKYNECDIELLFITSLSGNLYYVNNVVSDKYNKYQIIRFEGIYNVISMYNNENNDIYYLTYSGSEKSLKEDINNYIDF